MFNPKHTETNPYFGRQPPPDDPHHPSSPFGQVSPPTARLPALPRVQPQPPLHQPHAPKRLPTYKTPFPIQPQDQSRPSQSPSSSVPQRLPQNRKPRQPRVQLVEQPQPIPDAQSSPPPHDEQTQPLHTPTHVSAPPVQPPPQMQPRRAHHERSDPFIPETRKTQFPQWGLAIFCTLFWIAIIVGGLVVLIVYLVFRPHLPKFDISSATLNAAYLDMDYLLNADLTLLTNFSNPNRKVRNDFSYVILDLYYGDNAIATQYISPFSTGRLESRLANVHMISSQVRLPSKDSEKLKKQLEGNGLVVFEVKGFVRVRSKLGSFLRYSYWLYSYCYISLTVPPSGVLRASKCMTKR